MKNPRPLKRLRKLVKQYKQTKKNRQIDAIQWELRDKCQAIKRIKNIQQLHDEARNRYDEIYQHTQKQIPYLIKRAREIKRLLTKKPCEYATDKKNRYINENARDYWNHVYSIRHCKHELQYAREDYYEIYNDLQNKDNIRIKLETEKAQIVQNLRTHLTIIKQNRVIIEQQIMTLMPQIEWKNNEINEILALRVHDCVKFLKLYPILEKLPEITHKVTNLIIIDADSDSETEVDYNLIAQTITDDKEDIINVATNGSQTRCFFNRTTLKTLLRSFSDIVPRFTIAFKDKRAVLNCTHEQGYVKLFA